MKSFRRKPLAPRGWARSRITRKILSLASLAIGCGFASLHADVTLVEHIDGMATAIDSTEMVKAGHTRVDYAGGLSTIRDIKSGEMVRLLQNQKSYVRIPGRLTGAALDAMRQARALPKGSESTLTPTGRKDTISGYPAEEFTFSAASTKMSLWLTKAEPDCAKILKEMSAAYNRGSIGGMLTDIGLDMAALPGFPVRVVSESPSGQTVTATVVTVSAAPIADSEFQIPAGYKEMVTPRVAPPPRDAGMPGGHSL